MDITSSQINITSSVDSSPFINITNPTPDNPPENDLLHTINASPTLIDSITLSEGLTKPSTPLRVLNQVPGGIDNINTFDHVSIADVFSPFGIDAGFAQWDLSGLTGGPGDMDPSAPYDEMPNEFYHDPSFETLYGDQLYLPVSNRDLPYTD